MALKKAKGVGEESVCWGRGGGARVGEVGEKNEYIRVQ